MTKHRNSQKRFYDQDFVYFITVKTHGDFPYFKEEILCDLWVEELKICKELKKFKLFAFCLLSDHFHLLVQPEDKTNISKVIQAFKKNVSQDSNKIIGLFPEGANSNSRLHRVGTTPFRERFLQKYGSNQNEFPAFRWQKSFHDHVIRDERDLENHFDYTQFNFLKHDLPDDWKYTSLNFPELVDLIE